MKGAKSIDSFFFKKQKEFPFPIISCAKSINQLLLFGLIFRAHLGYCYTSRAGAMLSLPSPSRPSSLLLPLSLRPHRRQSLHFDRRCRRRRCRDRRPRRGLGCRADTRGARPDIPRLALQPFAKHALVEASQIC